MIGGSSFGDSDIASLVGELEMFAEQRGLVLHATLQPGAVAREITEAEEFAGAPLPASLKSFLMSHNGVQIWFEDREDARYSDLFEKGYSHLYINSTREIVKMTNNFREYLDGVALDEIATEAGARKAYRCIDVASVGDSSLRVAYSIDEARPNGEYAFVEAYFWTMDFATQLVTDLDAILISNSFEELFTRSVRYMLETGQGFRYWQTHPLS